MPVDAACQPPPDAVAYFWIDEIEVTSGSRVELHPVWSLRPWDRTPVPQSCLKALKVKGADSLKLSKDRGAVEVSTKARDADTAEVSASLGGISISGRIRVVDRNTNPLPGVWHQVGGTCPSREQTEALRRLGELVLRADGAFAVTWTPFESYRDYWGKWAWDRASHTITLTIRDGNKIPELFEGNGRAEVGMDGKLRLSGLVLDGASDASVEAECTRVFERAGS